MNTRVLKPVDGGVIVETSVSENELVLMEREVFAAAIRETAKAIGDAFIQSKGQEMIARIPLDSVLNQAVAHAVSAIGAASAKR